MPIARHFLESKRPYYTSIIGHTNSSHTPNIKNANTIDHFVGKFDLISGTYQTDSLNIKEMIIHDWSTFEDIFVGMKEAQLVLAASVNNVYEVNKLIDNYLVKPEKALEPYLMSTLFFDKYFTIGKKLLQKGAKIESHYLPKLVWSVRILIDRAKSENINLNRIKHYHFDHLYEKIEWIFKHGVVQQNDLNRVLHDCLSSYLCCFENCHDISDSAVRPLIPLLLKHSTDLSFKDQDQDGMTPMHWAVLKQCKEEVIVRLKQKGQHYFITDDYGVTPYDYALLNMNLRLLSCMRPEIDNKKVLNELPSNFFGELLSKLPEHIRHNVGLPGLLREDTLYEGQRRVLSLYQPKLIKIEKGTDQFATPMGWALLKEDLEEILNLINSGWNIYIETAFAKDFQTSQTEDQNRQKKITSFREAIDEVFGNLRKPNGPFIEWILVALECSKSSSGVSLASEFNYAFFRLGQKFTGNYIFTLFNAGLTGDVYYQETGKDLQDTINKYLLPAQYDNYDNLDIKAIRSFIKSMKNPENLKFTMNVPRSTVKKKEAVSHTSSNECQAMIKTMQDFGGKILE